MFITTCQVSQKFYHIISIENFLRRLLKSVAPSERHPERKLTHLNLEFTPVTDDHFESATLPSTLLELNLNGCREISEKTLMVLQKSCPRLTRLGKPLFLSQHPLIELYWNCRVTDFAMKKVAVACKDLEYVNLSGCKYLSDSTVLALCENCPQIYHLVSIPPNPQDR
jgi:hypothetical protein